MRNLNENPFYGVIKEYDHWVVLFRDKQVTIGSLIIMSKELSRHSLGDVSVEAWAQFGVVCRDIEDLLTETFGAEKFNYLALMMDHPEVHFHVIPRYSQPVTFAGHEFVDPDWPRATKRIAMEIDPQVLEQIKRTLIEAASS